MADNKDKEKETKKGDYAPVERVTVISTVEKDETKSFNGMRSNKKST